MRAIAVLMMIQGHTIDALLSPAAFNDSSPFFQIWQFGRGLTAPIFLFGSGFAYVIASARKSVGGKLPGAVLFKRIRWIGVLFLIGMLMHFPVPSIASLPFATVQQWANFNHVDVLRLMAVTLLGLLALILLSRNPKHLVIGASTACLMIVGVTPFLAEINWAEFVHPAIAGYLTSGPDVSFSIFPFSGYLFAGAAAAGAFLRWKVAGMEKVLVQNFLLAGVVLVILSFVPISARFGGDWHAAESPFLFSLRLGSVLVLWSLVGGAIANVRRLPRAIPVVGQHTLLIYVSHVVMLYGCSWSMGLKQMYGKELGFPTVLGVIAGLIVFSVTLALAMHTMKKERAQLYRLVPYAGMAILALFMIVLY